MKHTLTNSLIVKLSVMVILIESLILAAIGVYYHHRFETEIDKRIEFQIRIPGILMNRQLLRYESIADRDMITDLVGEELVDGIVVGSDRKIFYALHPADEGKNIAAIPGFDPHWLESASSVPMTLKVPSQHETFLVSITPLRAYEGAEPFFFVYLKVNTSRSETQKVAMFWLFLLGSLFCLLFTSAAMIVSLKSMITSPLHQLEENARQIAQGNLRQTIHVERQDELGRLTHSFLHMRDAIRQKITELQELNQSLEQKVEERTHTLQENLVLLENEITDRKWAEEALRKSKALLDATGRMARVGGWELDAESLEVHWTEETYRIHEIPIGYKPPLQEAINFFHEADRDRLSQAIQKALNSGESYDMELRFITARGRHLWTRTICHPQIVEGKTVKLLGTFQDITERKRAEEALRESEEKFRTIFEMALSMICIADIETATFLQVNPAFTVILGYQEQELLERPFLDFIHSDDIAPTLEVIEQDLQEGKSVFHFINRYRCKDGTYRWLDWMSHPNSEKGVTYAIAHDITDRKHAEEQIKAALQEKEVLLREIHHRVKNNLMVVTSLIEMQASQTTNIEALNLFRDLYNRVMAMSMVHEDLYQSKSLAQIEFSTYLERLLINIRQGFARTCAAIKIDAQNIVLNVQQAIPCGLIVAELVTNAFKYAFQSGQRPRRPSWEEQRTSKNRSEQHETAEPTPPSSQEDLLSSRQIGRLDFARRAVFRSSSGVEMTKSVEFNTLPPSREGNTIRVEMRKEGDVYTLVVSDNGVGLPPEFNLRASKTLGMSLVHSWAVHQLRGTLEITSQKGTKFIITFQENKQE